MSTKKYCKSNPKAKSCVTKRIREILKKAKSGKKITEEEYRFALGHTLRKIKK